MRNDDVFLRRVRVTRASGEVFEGVVTGTVGDGRDRTLGDVEYLEVRRDGADDTDERERVLPSEVEILQ
jgi:hypothetical protein